MAESRQTVLQWLGFNQYLDFERSKSLGRLIGFFLVLAAIIFLISACLTLIHFFAAAFSTKSLKLLDRGESIRNTGLALAAFVTAPLIIWRTTAAAKQVQVAAGTLYNEKISKALANLAARYEATVQTEQDDHTRGFTEWRDDVMVRVSAIDRLAGLGEEDPREAERIARLLALYIQMTFPVVHEANEDEAEPREETPRADLQVAVDAISRLLVVCGHTQSSIVRLDLSRCDFSSVDFSRKFLRGCDFSRSIFGNSTFLSCDLREATFYYCKFTKIRFITSNLLLSTFFGSKFKTNMNRSHHHIFTKCNLKGVDFSGVNFGNHESISEPDSMRDTFGSIETSGKAVEFEGKERWEDVYDALRGFAELPWSTELNAAVKEFKARGMESWVPLEALSREATLARFKLLQKIRLQSDISERS